MNSGLVVKIFGQDQRWHGPCTVIMDSDAAVATLGVDSILGGGAKQYAPRMISGRIIADAVCLLQDGAALLILQNQKFKQSTGEESIKQLLTIADVNHVVAIEFPDTGTLAILGLTAPLTRTTGSHPGTQRSPI